MWTVNGKTYESGAGVELIEGTYPVTFSEVASYVTPKSQTVNLTASKTLTVNYEKVKHTLSYTLTPSTAKWTVNGNSYASGAKATLPEDTYTVTFSDVSGYETPATQTINLTADKNVTVNYVQKTHTLSYTLTPSTAKWTVNGKSYASGASVKLAEGSYTVTFSEVASYVTPKSQTISLTADKSLTVNYEKAKHSLTYTLTPSTAKWMVNGNSYASGTSVKLAEGSYTVTFSAVSGYVTPASQTVKLTVDKSLTVNYEKAKHSLSYTLTPSTAKWTVNGKSYASGAKATLPEDTYTVTFSDVSGYETPAAQTVQLTANKSLTVNYEKAKHSLAYTLTPSTAKWTVNGNSYASGASVELVEGTYTVTFSAVSGYVTPASQTVKLTADKKQTVNYVQKTYKLTYTLAPSSAKWMVSGNTYASGASTSLPEGTYTVTFSSVSGYDTPAAQTFTLTADRTQSVSYTKSSSGDDTSTLYLVVDLSGGQGATSYPMRYSSTGPNLSDDTCRTTELWLRRIPKGTFMMGSPSNELGRQEEAYYHETRHQVTLTKDFYIGVFQVTQRQWELVMGTRPSYFSNESCYATRPVEKISYNTIRGKVSSGEGWPSHGHTVLSTSFFGKLRAKTGNAIFDLPTEAQWEYACRAGTTTALYSRKNLTNVNNCPNVAELGRYWYNGGSAYSENCDTSAGTAKVGSYKPNEWGLYDMYGNVWEWCLDWWQSDLGTGSVTDPVGAMSGTRRVLRGAGFNAYARICRSALRGYYEPGASVSTDGLAGFRVVVEGDIQATKTQKYTLSYALTPSTAKWTVNGTAYASGASVKLPEDTYTVTFSDVSGYETPAAKTVNLTADKSLTLNYEKVKHTLTCTLTPSSATWEVAGKTYASGAAATLPEDTYTVMFTTIAGYDTPVAKTVQLTANKTLTVKYAPLADDAFMVVDLSGGPNASSYPVMYTSRRPDVSDDACRTTELWLRRIPKGTFTMGSPSNELGRWDDETQHQVTLSQDFYIGVFEVTQRQWELVMGGNPSYYAGDTRPVEQVSYEDIRGTGSAAGAGWPNYGHAVDGGSFFGKLRSKTGNKVFDLPTEAQWEYACRAGTTTALNSGKNLTSTGSCSNMNEVGRYYYNKSDGRGGYSEHTKVGSYKPNAWGLYDMHGNVDEWCLDWYGDYGGTATDPVGRWSGSYRVLRGGSWYSHAQSCRSAIRSIDHPSSRYYSLGFRVACSSQVQ